MLLFLKKWINLGSGLIEVLLILVGGYLGATGPFKCYMSIIEAIPLGDFDTSLFGFNFSIADRALPS